MRPHFYTALGPILLRRFCLLAVGVLGPLFAGTGAADPGFEILPEAPGAPGEMHAEGISADGCTVVGWGGGATTSVPFRWRYGETLEIPTHLYPYDPIPTGTGRAYDVSDDGEVVVGYFDGDDTGRIDAFRWELDGDVSESFDRFQPYSSANAVSASGNILVGSGRSDHLPPFLWDNGVIELLPQLEVDESLQPNSRVLGLSADGSVAVGWGREGFFQTPAVRWDDGVISSIGILPGANWSKAEGISADGQTIVGTSDSGAFRWAGDPMSAIGGGAQIARSASGDGALIVGLGSAGAFIWDGINGTRDVATVLQDNHGFDLGDWALDDATAISDDGQTLIGYATNSLGDVRAWRAALGEYGCPPRPVRRNPYSLTHSMALDGPYDLAGAPDGNFYVGSGGFQNDPRVIRVVADLGSPETWEPVMDASGDGAANGLAGFAIVAAAPDGTLYVAGSDSQNGFRVDPVTDVAELFFDLSGEVIDLMSARPARLSVAPDGTVLLAALTRALRIDPDGTITELLDALTAKSLIYPDIVFPPGYNQMPLVGALPHPSGDFIVWSSLAIFRVSPGGEVSIEASFRDIVFDGIFDLAIYASGDLWVTDMKSLWSFNGGVPEMVLSTLPDGEGGTLSDVRRILIDPDGSLFLANGSPGVVVRVTSEGAVTRIADEDSERWAELSGVSDILLAKDPAYGDDIIYVAAWMSHDLIAAPVPPVPPTCSDGVDNDGDTAIDHPGDPGCVSPYDETEELVAVPEPSECALLAAGIATLCAVARRRRHEAQDHRGDLI